MYLYVCLSHNVLRLLRGSDYQKIGNPYNKKYAGKNLLGSLRFSCKAKFDILFTLDYRLTGESLDLKMKICGGGGGLMVSTYLLIVIFPIFYY